MMTSLRAMACWTRSPRGSPGCPEAGPRRSAGPGWIPSTGGCTGPGLTLEHATGDGPGELTLTGPDGERIVARPGRLAWPARADSLPDGPLRARLRPVTGVRALLPAARGESAVCRLRVLNGDAKTVAWLATDKLSVSYPASADLPSRLHVTAVRGYQAQADRVAQVLAGAPGVEPKGLPRWKPRWPWRAGPATTRASLTCTWPPAWRLAAPSRRSCCTCLACSRPTWPGPSATWTPSSCTTCGSRSAAPGPC